MPKKTKGYEMQRVLDAFGDLDEVREILLEGPYRWPPFILQDLERLQAQVSRLVMRGDRCFVPEQIHALELAAQRICADYSRVFRDVKTVQSSLDRLASRLGELVDSIDEE
jgi:hypothetical protein